MKTPPAAGPRLPRGRAHCDSYTPGRDPPDAAPPSQYNLSKVSRAASALKANSSTVVEIAMAGPPTVAGRRARAVPRRGHRVPG
eukprot:467899-Hanusia_phi.AAC.1